MADKASSAAAACDVGAVVATINDKKKRRRRKRKSGASTPKRDMGPPLEKCEPCMLLRDQAGLRGLGDMFYCDYYVAYGQTHPPTRPVYQLFPDGHFPTGEVDEHPGEHNAYRFTDAEKRAAGKALQPKLEDMRHAAEVHRQVRAYAMGTVRPGMKLRDIQVLVENKIRELTVEDGPKRGVGFPCGLSRNHIAAHATPLPGDTEVFGKDDIVSYDVGAQINGCITDSAFTMAFNPKFDQLMAASKAGADLGAKMAGIDVRLCDIGAAIQEVVESFEVELEPGRLEPVKVIRNLRGHNILPWRIHGGKSVPCVGGTDDRAIIEEGDVLACEVFVSVLGRGEVYDAGECSHYMHNFDAIEYGETRPLRVKRAKDLLEHIGKTFHTLPFSCGWLDRSDGGSAAVWGDAGRVTGYRGALSSLCSANYITAYPPLCEKVGAFTAQYEHTMVMRPTCKEILSRGQDY